MLRKANKIQNAFGFTVRCFAAMAFMFLVFVSNGFYVFAQVEKVENAHSRKYASLGFGKSVKQIPLVAKVFGEGTTRILVIGGFHGNERETVVLTQALAKSYETEDVPEGLTIAFVTALNPDGYKASTRVNARGVDINRNFPSESWRKEYNKARYFPGVAPATEPETKALISLIETFKPDLIISIHAPLACVNWDGPAEEYATDLAKLMSYSLCEDVGYQTPGSLGSFAGRDKNIAVVTAELRYATANPETMRLVPVFREMFKQVSLKKQRAQDETNAAN